MMMMMSTDSVTLYQNAYLFVVTSCHYANEWMMNFSTYVNFLSMSNCPVLVTNVLWTKVCPIESIELTIRLS